MKQQGRKELSMRGRQLSLLDEKSLGEMNQNNFVVIQVTALDTCEGQSNYLQAFVSLKENEMFVKGQLFDDCLGNHYVGCCLLKKEIYHDSSKQIPVYKSSKTVQEYVAEQLDPIINILNKKRKNYYAS